MTPLKPSLAGMLSFVSSVAIEVVDHHHEIAIWNFMRSPVKPHLPRLWLKLPSSLALYAQLHRRQGVLSRSITFN